jgi:hypothetical protein
MRSDRHLDRIGSDVILARLSVWICQQAKKYKEFLLLAIKLRKKRCFFLTSVQDSAINADGGQGSINITNFVKKIPGDFCGRQPYGAFPFSARTRHMMSFVVYSGHFFPGRPCYTMRHFPPPPLAHLILPRMPSWLIWLFWQADRLFKEAAAAKSENFSHLNVLRRRRRTTKDDAAATSAVATAAATPNRLWATNQPTNHCYLVRNGGQIWQWHTYPSQREWMEAPVLNRQAGRQAGRQLPSEFFLPA